MLLLLSPATIAHPAFSVTKHELAEDPNDLIAGYVLRSARHLGEETLVFATLYLVIHGVVNLGIAIALLNNRLWAYQVLIGTLVLFMGYQLYRYAFTHSLWLLLLTVFDAFLLWLSFKEYRKQVATTSAAAVWTKPGSSKAKRESRPANSDQPEIA